MGEYVRALLALRSAPAMIIAASALLSTSSLTLGFSVDEYFQRVALNPSSSLPGTDRDALDLFTFASPKFNALLMEEGIFPWWADRELLISFFRPLSSLTLYADHVLFRDNTLLFHVHNIAWYLLLLGAVWLVYREFRITQSLSALALLLYGLDDARAQVVGWISLRNAPIALIPAFLALIAHHRYRTGRGSHYGLLAPLGLALGLGGGEVAVAVCGYLFAYALFLDHGSLASRVVSLLPYVVLIAGYRVAYNALGYGALHSGLYVDPVREPLAFLYCIAAHLPVLVFAQFALPPAELWEIYPLVASWLQPAVYVLTLLGLFGLGKLLWPLFQESREARFWALGGLLATLPLCGTFPADRLLVAGSLGGAALLAQLMVSLFERAGARAELRRRLGYALVGLHCVFAPLYFSVRARDLVMTRHALAATDASIPSGPEIADKTVIVVNPVLDALGTYFPVYRAAHERRLPARFHYLATAESELLVERVDATTLKLRPEGGFLFRVSQRAHRSMSRPFHLGERITLSDMTFEVSEVSADGRPTEVLAHFERALEDPSLSWFFTSQRGRYAAFTPPPVGGRVLLPQVDALPLLFEAP
jgi:hypothetical protein